MSQSVDMKTIIQKLNEFKKKTRFGYDKKIKDQINNLLVICKKFTIANLDSDIYDFNKKKMEQIIIKFNNTKKALDKIIINKHLSLIKELKVDLNSLEDDISKQNITDLTTKLILFEPTYQHLMDSLNLINATQITQLEQFCIKLATIINNL